ncbi:MAG: SpoIIE family protein phosphatase [Clostridia bacterium]|nr:SpoIIE family protein phosphatase [Clostridia bacterium]
MAQYKLTYKSFLTFFISLLIFLSLTQTIDSFKLLTLPFYVSLIFLKFNPFLSTLAYLLSFIYDFDLLSLYSATLSAGVIIISFWALNKKKRTPNSELILITLISLAGFIFFDESLTMPFKLILSGVSLILVFVFINSTRVLFIKKFDYKITSLEILCLSVFVALFELGFIHVFGKDVLKALNVFIILTAIYTVGSGKAIETSLVLAIAPFLFNENFNYFAIYPILTLSASIFKKHSKIISCFALLATDLVFLLLLNLYGPFVYLDLIYVIAPVTIFLFLPNRLFDDIKNKVTAISNKYLSKYAVNRVRATISNRLYSVSDVFSEMEKSFDRLKELVSTDIELISKMADEVILNVCENCPQYVKCKEFRYPDRSELLKILSVGVAKNRISLIDLTKNFTENCGYVNGIIYEINLLIGKYREKVKESEDVLSGKELIRMQSEGVAGVLKGLAFDYSKNLEYSNSYELSIADALKKNGIIFNEILCYSNGEDCEINMVIKNEYLKNGRLLSAINEATGVKNSIVLKTAVSMNLSAITIRRSPTLDAAFGLSTKTKDGSVLSGDTHSLTKIDEGKFLIALSDGMGSGLKAENTSSTAISLIESFYKAGLNSKLILSMVNKVLALNTDENFSAMDILTVNLFNLTADFIKIGAPYSFILYDNSIKIVEGSSLPLGILDDLTPTGCTIPLSDDATVIMITDGISDAFGSSTDLIDFLRTLENRNPQEITDSILKKALNYENEVAKDDMSVLAVRIFKKAS